MPTFASITQVQYGRGNSRQVVSWQQWMQLYATVIAAILLPAGFWDRVFVGNTGGTWGAQIKDLSRWANFQRLMVKNGVSIIRTVVWSADSRNYTAFLVRGERTGRMLALVESDTTNNGLYLFDAESQYWLQVAQMTKNNFRPRNRMRFPEFIRKMHHNTTFQYRLTEFVRTY